MQFYSVQARENIEVADDKIEVVTMKNGKKAAQASVVKDGKTLKLFKFLPADSPLAARATGAPAVAEAKETKAPKATKAKAGK